jgi:hypothetical protein
MTGAEAVYFVYAAAAVAAVSAVSQAQSAKKAADFNAAVNAQNAVIAQQRAAAQAAQQERDSRIRLGLINANQGKSGGASGEGSVLDVIGDNASQQELQRQEILYRGQLNARGYTNTATLDTFQGKNAERNGYLQAGSALLSGAAGTYTPTRGSSVGSTNGGYDPDYSF